MVALLLALGCAPAATLTPSGCPSSPNCVSSVAAADDATHHIAPLSFSGSEEAARARARAIVEAMPRTAVLADQPGYLHATFTSKVWRFVDDVELWFDASTGVVHVRSASRVGHGDMGVNRERVEAIRAAWDAPVP